MRVFHGLLISVIVALFTSSAGFAQTAAPDPGAILQAWLASPHAQSASEAFRHWDDDGEIPGTCAVCHSTSGVVDYLASPMTQAGFLDHPVPTGTTVECAACHDPGVQNLTAVVFPSGASVPVSGSSAVCSVCHQGRASVVQVDAALVGLPDDEVSTDLGFINVHYAAAAATQLGGTVRGGYEYDGQSYVGAFQHVPTANTCASCHDPHESSVSLETCTTCHEGATTLRAIRTSTLDFLGDGDTTTGIASVIDALHLRLGDAIMRYAGGVSDAPIVYSSDAYPYFFNDLNADAVADGPEAIFPNRYQSWTPRLLRAAYNYQYVAKDHGAFAHNPHYVIQLMYDSLSDLAAVTDVDMDGLVRP